MSLEKKVINFLRNEGIIVKTNTKARGHQGICFKGRIDVSTKVSKERRIYVLVHEYAHKIHLDIEPDFSKKGGSLEKLFNVSDASFLKNELLRVTNFVDNNSLFLDLNKKKDEVKKVLKELERLIKQDNPEFTRTKEFVFAKKYFRKNNTKAKYLLKYDKIKLISPIFRKEEVFTIANMEKDFPQLPNVIKNYIKFLSAKRKQAKLSRHKNKATKYYNTPTELFARFIEGLAYDKMTVVKIAPRTYREFEKNLNLGYYGNLNKLLSLIEESSLELEEV